jgi:hypothetical protein
VERPTAAYWARLAVLLGLLLGTYGFVLNDEQEQAVALYNLSRGSVLVEERPEAIYPKVANITKELRYPGPEPIGSPLLNDLAMPMILALHVADAVMPLGVWVSLAVVALAWSLLPPHRRTRGALVVAALAFAALAKGFRVEEVAFAPYREMLALQATNLVVLGVAAGFAAAAIQRHAHGAAGAFATAAVVLGPTVFWGSAMKYTVLAIALTAIALWVAGEPPSRRRAMALGVAGAFAIWNNIGPGLVVAGAIGFLLLGEALASPREPERWRRFGLGALAGALGLAGWAAGNFVISGNPFVPTKILKEQQNIEALGQDTGGGPVEQVLTLLADPSNWNGPKDLLLDIAGLWTTGWRVEGAAIGVLALSPLLALAGWTLVRSRWWRRPDLACAVLMLALQVGLFSNRAVVQGWGYDARLVAPVLPAVGVLAAPGIQRVAGWMSGRAAAGAWAVALGWGAAVTALLVALTGLDVLKWAFRRPELLMQAFLVLAGVTIALAVLLAAASLLRHRPPPRRDRGVDADDGPGGLPHPADRGRRLHGGLRPAGRRRPGRAAAGPVQAVPHPGRLRGRRHGLPSGPWGLPGRAEPVPVGRPLRPKPLRPALEPLGPRL